MDENDDKKEYLLKISVLGSPDELKTEFIRSFAEGKFDTDYTLVQGVDITTKKIQIDNSNIKLIIVDTAGKEFFGKLRPSYYRGASACIICFEKTNESLKAANEFYHDFHEHIPDPKVPITFVCIKTGADETIPSARQILAKTHKAKYYEWKKDGSILAEEIFRDITRRALDAKD
jgi:small GTP-binding protein